MEPVGIAVERQVTGRMRGLDGLRGIAILAVLVCHLWSESDPSKSNALTRSLMGGWFGVDLFFALSGFLITGILLRARTSSDYFRHFYVRRTLRIFPLYFAFLLVVFIVLPRVEFTKFATPDAAYYWLYLVNLMPLFHAQESWQLGHFWSLAIEEQFYLIWPLVIYLTPLTALRIGIPIMVLGLMAMRAWWSTTAENYYVIYTFTLTHLDAILLGSLAAVILRDAMDLKRLHRNAGAVLIVALMILVPVIWWNQGSLSWDSAFGINAFIPIFSWIAAAVVLYVATAPQENHLRRVMEWPALVFFGTYSYCIYLVHNPIHGFVMLLASPGRPLHTLLAHTGLEHALTGVITLLLSVGIALASWHGYEKWFLRLKPTSAR
jgi:peptidoglycan/LPS O-acetylase OafA/YrhL